MLHAGLLQLGFKARARMADEDLASRRHDSENLLQVASCSLESSKVIDSQHINEIDHIGKPRAGEDVSCNPS